MFGVGNREVIHTEALSSFDDAAIEEAKERGFSWVQRNLLKWPYEHDLLYSIRTKGGNDVLEFFFVPIGQEEESPVEDSDWADWGL